MSLWSFSIHGGDYERGGTASRGLKDVLRGAGVDARALRRLMIATYEAEMNVVIHARGGRLEAEIGPREVRVAVCDHGPGIPDVALAMTEGYSTASEEARRLGFGAGLGLPNIRKHSDSFTVESTPGSGTRVTFRVAYEPQRGANPAFTSLAVRAERCQGCGRCVRACPTAALRLREGAPRLLAHACVECCECAAVCPGQVFAIEAHPLPQTTSTGATAPGWQAGAPNFATGWLDALRRACAPSPHAPVLVPVCAAVLELIATRYPALLDRLAPYLTPLEAEASVSGEPELVACPAQRSLLLTGGVAPERLCAEPELERTGGREVRPAWRATRRGSTAIAPLSRPVLRITGMRNTLRALDALDEDRFTGHALVELYACPDGCAASPYVPCSSAGVPPAWRADAGHAVRRSSALAVRYGQRLDASMTAAVEKLATISALIRELPQRDCVECGAPSCRAFAEDMVLGRAPRSACPHVEAEAWT